MLNGAKRWITNGSIADCAIVWAKLRDENDPNSDVIRGFLVEKARGFSRPLMHGKWSLRVDHVGADPRDCFIPRRT